MLNIDSLTVGEIKEISKMIGGGTSCKKRITKDGDKIFIRTLTYHYTGRVVCETDDVIILKDGAWIADSGRFMDAISNGTLKEIEPIEACLKILKQNISDIIEWKHDLPKNQK